MRRTALLLCVAHLALPAALRAAGRRAGRGSALRAIGDRTDVA